MRSGWRKKQRFSRHYIRLLLLVSLLFVSGFLLAEYFWLFDAFSYLSLYFAVVSVVLIGLLLLSKRIGWALCGVAMALWMVSDTVLLWRDHVIVETPHYEDLDILQYNVDGDQEHIAEIMTWLLKHSQMVDVVVLHNVTDAWKHALAQLKWTYPYHLVQDIDPGYQMVVLSRLTIDEMEIRQIPSVEVPVMIMRGESWYYNLPFVLYAMQAPGYFSVADIKRRDQLLAHVAKDVAEDDAPYKLWMGDFQLPDIAVRFKSLVKKSGLYHSMQGQDWLQSWPNFMPKPFGFNVDHTLLSGNISVQGKELGPAMGASHRPIITHLRFYVDPLMISTN